MRAGPGGHHHNDPNHHHPHDHHQHQIGPQLCDYHLVLVEARVCELGRAAAKILRGWHDLDRQWQWWQRWQWQ